jgi:hypothetical protein
MYFVVRMVYGASNRFVHLQIGAKDCMLEMANILADLDCLPDPFRR